MKDPKGNEKRSKKDIIEKKNEELEEEEEEEEENVKAVKDDESDSSDDSVAEYNENSCCGRCGANLAFIVFIVISILTSLIQKYGPPEQHGGRKIMHPQQEVDKLIADMGYYMDNPQGFIYSIGSAFTKLGQLLNNSKTAVYALTSIANNGFTEKLQKQMTRIANTCENPIDSMAIMFSCYFLHDYAATSGDVIVDKNAIKKILTYCNLNDNTTRAAFSYLMMAAQTNNGKLSMSGVGQYVTEYAKSLPFGVWTIRPLAFYAIWASNTALYSNDKKAMCSFVDFILESKESWSHDFKQVFCELKPHINKCDVMQKPETSEFVNFCNDF